VKRYVAKAMVLTSLTVLAGVPAAAQIRADLGPIHIRIATDAPPPVRYERQTARPHRDAVWCKGYWDRQDDRWLWRSGRWEQRSKWINAKYKREGRAWRYEPAHWSHQRVVEGEDYQRWKEQQRSDRDGRQDRQRSRDEDYRRD